MLKTIILILLKIASSKVAEEVITVGVDKLVDSTKAGIGKDLAKTMINGISKSKHNRTSPRMFEPAMKVLE